VFGSLFFASVTKLEALMEPGKALPDIVILEMGKVINIDTTGLDTIQSLHATLARRAARLILADLNEQPRSLISRAGFLEVIGRENVVESLHEAMEAARR